LVSDIKEEQRLRVFENRVLKKIFELKRDEVMGEWMYHKWGRRGTCIGYWWESQRERDHSEGKDVGGWIILRWIL
jgi:hypothetical protein